MKELKLLLAKVYEILVFLFLSLWNSHLEDPLEFRTFTNYRELNDFVIDKYHAYLPFFRAWDSNLQEHELRDFLKRCLCRHRMENVSPHVDSWIVSAQQNPTNPNYNFFTTSVTHQTYEMILGLNIERQF